VGFAPATPPLCTAISVPEMVVQLSPGYPGKTLLVVDMFHTRSPRYRCKLRGSAYLHLATASRSEAPATVCSTLSSQVSVLQTNARFLLFCMHRLRQSLKWRRLRCTAAGLHLIPPLCIAMKPCNGARTFHSQFGTVNEGSAVRYSTSVPLNPNVGSCKKMSKGQ
jgi:hypothetical protein